MICTCDGCGATLDNGKGKSSAPPPEWGGYLVLFPVTLAPTGAPPAVYRYWCSFPCALRVHDGVRTAMVAISDAAVLADRMRGVS